MTRKRGEFFRFQLEKLPFVYLFSTVPLILFVILGSVLIAKLLEVTVNPVVSSIIGVPAGIVAKGLTLITPVSELYGWQIVGAFILLLIVPILAYFVHFTGTDRVYEYTCGEKLELNIGTYDFFCIHTVEPFIETAAVALFVLTLVLGGGLV